MRKLVLFLIVSLLFSGCAASADNTGKLEEGVYVYALTNGYHFLGVAQDTGTCIYAGPKYAYTGRRVIFRRSDGSTLEVFFPPGAPLVFSPVELPFTGEPWIQ